MRNIQKRELTSQHVGGAAQFRPESRETHSSSSTDDLIGEVFQVRFPPGLTLFNNTTPIDPKHTWGVPPYSTWPQPLTEAPIIKVSRDSNGKLTAVPSTESHTTQVNVWKDTSPADSSNADSYTDHATEAPLMNYVITSDDCVESASTFCTNVRNYPEEKFFEEIINKNFTNLNIFFGKDITGPDDISQRMNSDFDSGYENLCGTVSRVVKPKAGKDPDENYKIIVNTEKYIQAIHVEECINEGSACGVYRNLQLPNTYNITCKQSYIVRSLVSVSDGKLSPLPFKFPSCCKCVLKTG